MSVGCILAIGSGYASFCRSLPSISANHIAASSSAP
jgi:hypothetical protein